MRFHFKRIVAFVFSAILCLSLFAIPAFAADEDEFEPVDVGEWTLYKYIGDTGHLYQSYYYAMTTNPIVALYSDYKYTGSTKDNDGNTIYALLVQYDSNHEFICRVEFKSTNDYVVHVEPNCAYVVFELRRLTGSGIHVTLSDTEYYAIGGSGVGNCNFPYLLYNIGEVITNALKWVVVTVSTIAANNILMLFCVALPLCGLGVGMFSRLIRARG